MFPQNSYAEILTHHVIIFGGGALRRWLGHEGSAVWSGMGLVSFTKKNQAGSFLSPSCEDKTRIWQSLTWKRILTRTQPCWYPDCRLPTCEKKFLLFVSHLVYDIIIITAWSKTPGLTFGHLALPWIILNRTLSWKERSPDLRVFLFFP